MLAARSRRLVLPVLALPVWAGALAATPGTEATIVVEGEGSGTAVLRLDSDITIDRASAYPGGPIAVRHDDTTDFAGVVLQPVDGGTWHLLWVTDVFGPDRSGGVSSEEYGDDGLPEPEVTLPEGEYLVHLIADGPTSIEVVARGLGGAVALEVTPDPEVGLQRATPQDDVASAYRTWTSSHEATTDSLVISFGWIHTQDPFATQTSLLCTSEGRDQPENDDLRSCSSRDLGTGQTYLASSGGRWNMRYSWPAGRATVAAAWHVAQVGPPQEDSAGLLQAWWPNLDPEA